MASVFCRRIILDSDYYSEFTSDYYNDAAPLSLESYDCQRVYIVVDKLY